MQNEIREKVQDEAFKELIKYKRRTAAISMRVGKTLIGLRIIANTKLENRVLIVAPKLSIFNSWKDDILKFGYSYLEKSIEYVTYRSFNKLDLAKYDLIIFDECHTLKISHVGKEKKMSDYGLKLGQYKGDILGLTGTPPTNSYSEKARMIDAYCPIVYKYDTEDAIDTGILNDYRIVVHLLPLSNLKDIHVKTASHDFYSSEAQNYLYLTKVVETSNEGNRSWNSITRMKKMQTYKSKEVYTKKLLAEIEHKCIVFTNTKEQADSICEHSYHSTNSASESNLQLFKIGVIDRLSCVLQLSEGVTIPDLKASIIMHSYGNEVKFSQRFARCLSLTTDDMSNVHLLCYKGTVDESWVRTSLAALDPSKVRYIEFK